MCAEGEAAPVKRICFVCLGNICRSPLAEGVFKHLAAQAGQGDQFHVESAGLGSWHVGETPDHRSQQVARQHGVALDGLAQQFRARDFARFDLVLALDQDIHDTLRDLAPSETDRAKVRLLRQFDPEADGRYDVPDPYYGDMKLFERVYALIERSCRKLLDALTTDAA
jgi:protein-tyrosine phosphatase